jgi:two-component sensor histidine kinase
MPKADPAHEVESSLLMAVIHSSDAPLILLDQDLRILAASDSFIRSFLPGSPKIEGLIFNELGNGEWGLPQLKALLDCTAGGVRIDAYEMDLKREGLGDRRLTVNAQKLAHSDPSSVRVLLTILDITDARIADKLKSDLIREKSILLQELQHRVANSLQIIASVLMQSAKRTQSEETRANLHDAHSRIMSIAQLQQQLAVSRLGDVELRTYFGDLCRSIGASMIRDHNQIKLEVTVDDSVAHADVSVSLGLMVTELVINSLKHAFPGGRVGLIKVGYGSDGTDWTLSVSDNGIGLPTGDAPEEKPGLGTSIVAALASSLGADVQSNDARPGLTVSIVHH